MTPQKKDLLDDKCREVMQLVHRLENPADSILVLARTLVAYMHATTEANKNIDVDALMTDVIDYINTQHDKLRLKNK